jgi:WD40 repeat protein
VAVDPTGSWLITGRSDGTIRLWDLRAHKPFAKWSFVLRGHGQPVRQLAITPNGRWLATGSPDRMLRLWDLAAKDPTAASRLLCEPSAKELGKASAGWALETSGNSRWLVARSRLEPARTRIWDLRAGDIQAKPIVLQMSASLEFCRNGCWLVAGSGAASDKAEIWDLNADDPWARPLVFPRLRRAAADALSPDGRWLFARHRRVTDPTKDDYLFWDLKEAKPADRILISHPWPTPPRAADISPDGRWLAVAFDPAGKPEGVDLWDLRRVSPAFSHRFYRAMRTRSERCISARIAAG